MTRRQIIMNYSVPPSVEDLQVIASEVLDTLPEELLAFCEDLCVRVEDIVDEPLESELGLDDPYDLLALYRNGRELSPGVEKRTGGQRHVLILYRRAVLDVWIETGEDIVVTTRQIMIEELGRSLDFSEPEIEDMISRHYQGLL